MKEAPLAIYRRRQIGLIYQFYNLIPILNVEENIMLPLLRDCEFHSTQMLHSGDEGTLRRLGLRVTCEAVYPGKDLFF